MISQNEDIAYPITLPLELVTPMTGNLLDTVHAPTEFVSMLELKHLITLLDQGDVTELEIRSSASSSRLVLRKAQTTLATAGTPIAVHTPVDMLKPVRSTVIASQVGIFYACANGQGPVLASLGDEVKEGQHVGVIRTLDVSNEVEAPVTGTVTELLVKDGQPIEYGQPLMIIEQR